MISRKKLPEHGRAEAHRRMRFSRQGLAALAIFAAATGIASAQRATSPVGIWRVEDGTGNVRIARCGRAALCGFADNGSEIFVEMKRSGASAWSGEIRDIRDNSKYDGTISVVEAGKLLVHGCLPGGGMCGDQTWTRAR